MWRKKRDVLVQDEKQSFTMNPKTHESQRHGTRIRVVVPLRVTTLDPKAEFSLCFCISSATELNAPVESAPFQAVVRGFRLPRAKALGG